MSKYSELAKSLVKWIDEEEHYSVVHFAIEHGIGKGELMRLASEDLELGLAVDYALSVQEYKVADGAMRGVLDRNVSMKMLETYAGWKAPIGMVNVISNSTGDVSGLVEKIERLRVGNE